MRFGWICFIEFVLLVTSSAAKTEIQNKTKNEFEEAVRMDVEKVEADLTDICNMRANVQWDLYSGEMPNWENKGLQDEVLGKFQKSQADSLQGYQRNSSHIQNSVLRRKLELLTSIGDALVDRVYFIKVAAFSNSLEERNALHNIPCFNSTDDDCVLKIKDVEDKLRSLSDSEELSYLWSKWHEKLDSYATQFPDILNVVNLAAEANGMDDVESYWSMLTEVTDGYDKLRSLWDEIKPLYKKLQHYVFYHIYMAYGTEVVGNEKSIVANFLGSLSGSDWSVLADILLPKSDPTYKILDSAFSEKFKSDRELYKVAQNMTLLLGLPPLSEDFWESSLFDHSTCPTQLVKLCMDDEIRVATCGGVGLQQYLDAHVKVMQAVQYLISFKAESYSLMFPVRISALQEATTGLSTLLAMSPHRLKKVDILTSSNDNNQQLTLKFLIALQILPKLSYFVTADLWRLKNLRNNSENIVQSWWNMRKEIQGITFDDADEEATLPASFLDDVMITSNKPYLGKFLGTILQFQIFDVLFVSEDQKYGNNDLVKAAKKKELLSGVIKSGFSLKWPQLLQTKFGINSVESSSLIKFFQPVEQFLDQAISKFGKFPTLKEKKVLESKSKVISKSLPPADAVSNTVNPSLVKAQDNGNVNKKTEGEERNLTVIHIAIAAGCITFVAVLVLSILVIFARQRHRRILELERRRSIGDQFNKSMS